VRCRLKWMDLGSDPGIHGCKCGFEGHEPMPNVEKGPPMPCIKLASYPPLVAHATRVNKGKEPLGSGRAQAKFPLKPKMKSLK
jgi:hypothetical protein